MPMRTWSNNDFCTDMPYTLRDVVEGLGYEIGLDDYPIFDEAYRPKLNQAILDHFWYRRICPDTPAKFIFFLNRYMREQMPNINPIYAKIREENFDPLATSQRSDRGASNASNASETTSVGSGDGTNITSRTPQVYLDNPSDPRYMDALGTTKSASTGNDKTSGNNNSAYNATASATDGGYASAIYDMLSSGFMATDTIVFSMLEPLFLQFTDDQPM